MDAATIVTEVAALQEDVAVAALSAEAAADSAARAAVAAEVLESQVEQASQAAAVAIVEEVRETARETEWNTERLDRMQTELTEIRSTVAPLMATLEALTASVALLVNNSSSAALLSSEPATPNPPSASEADPPALENLPVAQPPEAEPKPQPAKQKGFRLMR